MNSDTWQESLMTVSLFFLLELSSSSTCVWNFGIDYRLQSENGDASRQGAIEPRLNRLALHRKDTSCGFEVVFEAEGTYTVNRSLVLTVCSGHLLLVISYLFGTPADHRLLGCQQGTNRSSLDRETVLFRTKVFRR